MSTQISQINGTRTVTTQESERVSSSSGRMHGGKGYDVADGKTDEVSLSDNARRLLEVQQRMSGQPDVDEQRVAAIRQALDQGSYRIDAAQLSDALLAQERLFLTGDNR